MEHTVLTEARDVLHERICTEPGWHHPLCSKLSFIVSDRMRYEYQLGILLAKHLHHLASCPQNRADPTGYPACNCGLSELLSRK